MIRILLTFGLMILTLNTSAQVNIPAIRILPPTSSGTGCPTGSVEFTVSPDNTAVSALFNNYNLRIGGSTNLKKGQLSCSLAIPLQLPKGLRVAVLGLDYRGFAALPKDSQMVFKTKDGIKINGQKYEDASDSDHEFHGQFNDNFIISRRKNELKWSSCGGRIDLYLQSQVLMETHADEALFALDSADASIGFHYLLKLSNCSG